MLIPLDTNQTHPWAHRSERAGRLRNGEILPGATVFHCVAPSYGARRIIANAMTSGGGGALNLGDVRSLRIKYGVKRVENYPIPLAFEQDPYGVRDQGGKIVEVVSDAFLATLREDVLDGLALFVNQLMSVGEDALGNFGTGSQPHSAPSTSEPAAAPAEG